MKGYRKTWSYIGNILPQEEEPVNTEFRIIPFHIFCKNTEYREFQLYRSFKKTWNCIHNVMLVKASKVPLYEGYMKMWTYVDNIFPQKVEKL